MRSYQISLLTVALIACPSLATAAPAPVAGNLGDRLLDDDLAKSLSKPSAKQPSQENQQATDRLPNQQMLNRLLQEGVPNQAGEDVGSSPLTSIVSGMKRAEAFLSDSDSDQAAVPVQREVVTQLEKMIAQMEKQCESCKKKSSKPDDKKKQASKRSKPKEGKPGECDKEGEGDKPGSKPGKKPGQKANQSGTTSLAGAPNAETPEEQQELMKAAWGHLPERMRERMMQGAGSEFLPEYRNELQQYYRKLAERTGQESP